MPSVSNHAGRRAVRTMWGRLRWLGGVLLLTAGCWTTEPSLKPPPQPERYATPPQDDPRFSRPIQYPKETLNQPPAKKSSNLQNSAGGGPKFGSGSPGMAGAPMGS